jgi:hypothetical protein
MSKKISNTKVGIVSPITTYADGKEAKDVASQYLKVFPANIVGTTSNISTSLDDNDLSLESNLEIEIDLESQSENKEETDSKKEDIVIKKAPLLSDVELVSNSISYDATGTPSVTVVFKVRNSSGQSIKAVNARVQI